MELHVWPSDFSLPSIDPACLQFLVRSENSKGWKMSRFAIEGYGSYSQACAKMCASPITIVKATTPWKSPTGKSAGFQDVTITLSQVSIRC